MSRSVFKCLTCRYTTGSYMMPGWAGQGREGARDGARGGARGGGGRLGNTGLSEVRGGGAGLRRR